MNSRRYSLFCALLLSAMVSTGITAESETVTRTAVLENVARAVIVPRYQKLAEASHRLSSAAQRFQEEPSEEVLGQARQAWVAAANAASGIRCFQNGPMSEREFGTTFYYAQILPKRIEAILASVAPLSAAKLEEQGATVKGMFALEYLLFDRPGETNANRTGELLSASLPRRVYVLLLAEDLETKATQLAGDWANSQTQGAQAQFVAAGQESVQVLVNNLTKAIEELYERRLNFVMALPAPISRQVDRIVRSRSGGSLDDLVLYLESVREFYQGGAGPGLDDLVSQLNPVLAKGLQQQFERALGAVGGLEAPLEQAVADRRPQMEAAAKEIHALEILFKVDLTSALGVTLTFSSTDGD